MNISIFTYMNKEIYYVVGVMSGTSLDGLDLSYVKLEFKKKWKFNILKSETFNYGQNWKSKLSNAILLGKEDLHNLDIEYSLYLSHKISKFILDNNVKKEAIVCSHGHTVFHQPEKGISLQIGNLKQLTNELNNLVVCDFRTQDVKLGGQGAPLVPIGDKLLFYNYDFCLNLGGFANISFEEDSKRIAFDVCPVNIVLNYYSEKLGLAYDVDGTISKQGAVNSSLLESLNNLNFYKQKHPKSLGLEWVKKEVFPLIDSFDIANEDILRTFVEHIAVQINNSIKNKPKGTILVTGGGVFNSFLIKRIENLSRHKTHIPEDDIVNYKEALIFGLLGVLKLRNEVNCLSSVTGVTKDHSSGKVFK